MDNRQVQVEPVNLGLWLAERKRQEAESNPVYPVFVTRTELGEFINEQVERDLLKIQMSAAKIEWWLEQSVEDWDKLFKSV